jgi:hypothetical protein
LPKVLQGKSASLLEPELGLRFELELKMETAGLRWRPLFFMQTAPKQRMTVTSGGPMPGHHYIKTLNLRLVVIPQQPWLWSSLKISAGMEVT